MAFEFQDFHKDVIERSDEVPVVVDFWAPWCGPCKALGPIIEKLAHQAAGRWELIKVNVDEFPDIAGAFQIQSIPSVKMVYQGRLVSGFNGALQESQIKAWLDEHLPVPEGSPLQVAEEMFEQGNFDAARTILEGLMREPEPEAKTRYLLARAIAFENPARAAELLSTIDTASEMAYGAEKLGELLKALTRDLADLPKNDAVSGYYVKGLDALKRKAYEEALDQFLEVLYRDRSYDEEGAKRAIIGLFDYLGKQHPIAKAYHRRFEMALF